MSNEWRIYISHDKILLSNDHGFRIEFDLPSPGDMVAITLNEHTYHFGIYPSIFPNAPATSTSMSQSDLPSSDPSVSPNPSFPESAHSDESSTGPYESGGSENPIQL